MAPTLPGDGAVNILVVAENQILADVLAMRLREQPQVGVVGVARSVEDARAVALEIRPAVMLIDGDGRDDSPQQLIAELPETAVRPAVLMLSDSREPGTIVTAFESGVRGWVTTEESFASLWEAIREVRDGHMVLSPWVVEPVIGRLVEALRNEESLSSRRDFVANVSPREYEVLRCLVQGLNTKEVAARLYLSVNTVRTHVQHLLRHADEHTTVALVAAARELGVPGIDQEP
jgi:DNA-binding NarL/FixJ family response regulator